MLLVLAAGCSETRELEPVPPTVAPAGSAPADDVAASTPPTAPTQPTGPTPPAAPTPAHLSECPAESFDADDPDTLPKPPTFSSPTTGDPPTPPDPMHPAIGLGDRFYPLAGNQGYDVVHYDISLDVEPSTNTIDATTTLTAVATDDLARFNLDFHGLEVATVTVDGTRADFVRQDDEMTIRPATPIPTGARFVASVSYSGTPQPIPVPGVPAPLGWRSLHGTIFTSSEPTGAMTWYPNNNHPTDKATFTFRITVPDGVTAAASGILTAETSSNGRTTTTWRMDDPMATYLAAVYIGNFERHEKRMDDGLLIRDYVHPRSDPLILDNLSITPRAVRFLEEILGPYPFDAYGTIVMPFTLGWAMENQTLSIHGCLMLDPYVIAHELAHQWMGNSVTVDNWDQIWLHEGFAHYLGRMFLADYWELDIESFMADEHDGLSRARTPPPGGIEIDQLLDSDIVYRRGGMTLHALRTYVGDEVFFDILRTHYDQTAGATTNTEIFLDVVGRLGGSDAVALVKSWIYDPDVPKLPTPREQG